MDVWQAINCLQAHAELPALKVLLPLELYVLLADNPVLHVMFKQMHALPALILIFFRMESACQIALKELILTQSQDLV